MFSAKISLDKFVISNPDLTGSMAKVFIPAPEPDLKEKFGQLILLLEINCQKIYPPKEKINKIYNLIEILVSFVDKKYYQENTEARWEKYFEKFLQELNQWLDNNFYTTDLGAYPLNVAVITIKETNILFALLGEPSIKLFQQETIVDLSASEKKSARFSQIVSGVLNFQDILLFSTGNFFDYFSVEKAQNIITKNQPPVASKLFLESLRDQKDRITLAGLIIKNEENSLPFEAKETSVIESKKTKKTKKEPLSTKPAPTKISVEKKEIVLPTELLVEKKDLTILEKPRRINRLKKAASILVYLGRFIIKLFSLLQLNKLTKKFVVLNKLERALIIIALVLTIIFVGSLISFSKKTGDQETVQKYHLTITETQTKINELKATLIYNDRRRAKELISEIEILLKNLPQRTDVQKEDSRALRQAFAEQTDKLYQRTNLTEPKVIIDPTIIDPKIQLASLLFTDNNLYGFDKTSGAVYRMNLQNKNLEKIIQLSQSGLPFFKILALDKETLFFIKNNGEATLFNLTIKKVFSANIDSSRTNRNIDQAIIYAGRLYTLEKNSKQIYKYTKTASGFGKEEVWFKESVDLSNVVSLAADGNIYLMETNGKILKFYKGKQASFTSEEIWPVFESPTKILTWLEAKNLYLLEPINKRIVIFDKAGKLIKQIYSDKFTDLKDFTINEKENKIWLLNNQKIVEVEM